jgi:hypothetical protein
MAMSDPLGYDENPHDQTNCGKRVHTMHLSLAAAAIFPCQLTEAAPRWPTSGLRLSLKISHAFQS